MVENARDTVASTYVQRTVSKLSGAASLCSVFLVITSLGMIFNYDYTVKFHFMETGVETAINYLHSVRGVPF